MEGNPSDKSGEADDLLDPQTEYGRTKRMGEELVETMSQHYIIRTAWKLWKKTCLYHAKSSQKPIKRFTVVNDQHGQSNSRVPWLSL